MAFPETQEDIRHLLARGRSEGWTLIPYGGGTSVAGHITPEVQTKPVLTISLARMNRLIDIDPLSQIATFGPGARGPEVEEQLAEHGYVLGHYPQSFELSTIGGWVATRSSGQQSLRYGRIEQLFAGCTLETFNGPLEVPTFPASSAGPDIRELILGSEGRFGIISEVKVRVSPVASAETFHVAFAPSWDTAIELARRVAQQRIPLVDVAVVQRNGNRNPPGLGGAAQIHRLARKVPVGSGHWWQKIHDYLRADWQPCPMPQRIEPTQITLQ